MDGTRNILIRLAFAVAALVPCKLLAAAGPVAVALGETAHFAILAGTTVTYPGSGTVHGDVGLSPGAGSAILIPAVQVVGKIYAVDAGYGAGALINPTLLTTAKGDLTIAYNYAKGLTPVPTGAFLNPGAGNIGGLNLVPGLYKFDTEAHIDGADLTLTGGPDDVWIFQVGTALKVEAGSNRSVILAGGAQAKNVFWQVGSSATLGTYSVFKGTIMAEASITLDVGSKLEGRALAFSGQVVFNGDAANLPNVTLTIVSAHGTGLPPVGSYTHYYGTTLTNLVTGTETLGGTQYVATGWSMTGNGPALGSTTNMVMVQTNSATLTWQWGTNYLLNASAAPNGSLTGSTNGFYTAGSTNVVTAVPGPGYHFAGWTGNVSGLTNAAAQTLTMDQARTAVAHFALDAPLPVVLAIVSAHGLGQPLAGVYTNVYGTTLTNLVTGMETLGGTQYVATGWIMTGNEPASGSVTNMVMVQTNSATLTWQWGTNYLLNASAAPNGSLTGSTNGFYTAGSTVVVTAVPSLGYQFAGWTGNVGGPLNAAVKTMTLNQARTAVAHFALETAVLLTIVSEHGAGLPPAGVYANASGAVLTNRVTLVETLGGVQYVSAGWRMTGNAPASGGLTNMVMTQTNSAVLTWLWSTNYDLTLTATHGAITNATQGWKPANWSYDLYPAPAFGYVFDHWVVNGVNRGVAVPLNITMDAPQDVTAVFSPLFIDVTAQVGWSVNWVFDPRKGYFLGTLTISNTNSLKVLLAPIWYEVQSNAWHWLLSPSGYDIQTGNQYTNISFAVTNQLPGIGNGDLALDPGESVTVTGIQLMGRRDPTGLVVAVWADPPGTSSAAPDPNTLDTDHDGIPNVWENRHPGICNANNPFDAQADSDGDGVTNIDEYIADTNPEDPASVFLIRLKPDGAGVTWDGRPGRTYTVWATRDLREAFTVVASGIDGVGPETAYATDAQTLGLLSAGGAIFYRVEVMVK